MAAKFEALKPELDKAAAGGQAICNCTRCNFGAAVMGDGGISGLKERNCRVCGTANKWLSMECSSCGNESFVYDGRLLV